MNPGSGPAPRWDLSPLYDDLDGPSIETDLKRLGDEINALEAWTTDGLTADAIDGAAVLAELVARLDGVIRLRARLGTYTHCRLSTDSRNDAARRRLSQVERMGLGLGRVLRRLDCWLADHAAFVDAWCASTPALADYRQTLRDRIEDQRWRMPPEQEDLAADLLVSGGGSLWKLQQALTTQLTLPFERDGATESLPLSVVRNLAHDPNGEIRHRAYLAELRGCATLREAVAFALNGVKGSALSLARRRGYPDVLAAALHANRIDHEILEVLLDTLRRHLPAFRRYLHSKARRLGKDRLPWWDLLAPVGRPRPPYTWPEAETFVVEQFGRFDAHLAGFAREAFARRWIDAEPRDGKTGGGFCAGVPAVEESRILINFDGSLDQVATLAHELGHAFHNHCQRGLPILQRGAPSTLAETASTFCETIVFDAALDTAPSPAARLAILDSQLLGATQVIVDIYSRFRFESEFFRRRAGGDVGAEECCAMMLDAQREAYGDGLDPHHLHPYAWLLKPHYYSVGGGFYNFPYAFGLLFGLGIYAVRQVEPRGFLERYRALLRGTGQGKVAEQAARFGIDVRTPAFWESAFQILAARIDEYERLP